MGMVFREVGEEGMWTGGGRGERRRGEKEREGKRG